MPLATLKYPRSITKLGKTFFQGVSLPISDEVALQLQNDKRFDVKGLAGDVAEDRARLEATSGGRPHVRAVRLEHIRLANDTLDPDVTENYEVNGLPSIAGLAKAMGWTPDENEIREALRIKRRIGNAVDLVEDHVPRRRTIAPTASAPPISRRLTIEQQEAMIENPESIPDKVPDDDRVPTISMSESGSHFVNLEQIPPHVEPPAAKAKPKAKEPPPKFINVKNRGRHAPVVDKTKGAVEVT